MSLVKLQYDWSGVLPDIACMSATKKRPAFYDHFSQNDGKVVFEEEVSNKFKDIAVRTHTYDVVFDPLPFGYSIGGDALDKLKDGESMIVAGLDGELSNYPEALEYLAFLRRLISACEEHVAASFC